MKYVRKWECAICCTPVIVDTAKNTVSCKCQTNERPPEVVREFIKTVDFREKYELLSA